MISAWTKHITDPEAKERFQSAVQGSKLVLQRLQAIMDEMRETLKTKNCQPNYMTHLRGHTYRQMPTDISAV